MKGNMWNIAFIRYSSQAVQHSIFLINPITVSCRLKHPAQQNCRTSPDQWSTHTHCRPSDLLHCSVSTPLTDGALTTAIARSVATSQTQEGGARGAPVDEPPARCYNINTIFSSGVWSYKLHNTNIFKLHSYRVFFVECFVTYSAITAYLLTTFSHNFVAVKTPLMSLQNVI